MLAARTTQQGRLKMLLRLCSFVGVALVLALYSDPSSAANTESKEYRACQTAKGDSSKTAKFMQSLTQPQLTKFLNKNQSCDAF